MSQNQSFFWQTTRHNVYLKRTAKLQMLLALLAVLTFGTICRADVEPKINDDNGIAMGTTPQALPAEKQFESAMDVANELPNNDASVKDKTKASGFVDAFTASISVILFTELGDKTFFIAAIMAMRHPRLIVFSGAITALALMTVLSVVFGMAAQIIPKVYTYYISTALFAIFGLKMIYEGYFMKATDAQEELEEVQSDLRKREDELLRSKRSKYEENDVKRKNSNSDKEDIESGECVNGTNDSGVGNGISGGSTNSPVTVQNPEMEHRQRKQRSSNHMPNSNNNNNNTNNNNNSNNNNKHSNKANPNKADCDLNNATTTTTTMTTKLSGTTDANDSGNECDESDVFLQGNGIGSHGSIHSAGGGGIGGAGETIKMSTFHSSPAISSIASNQTTQTHCDDDGYPNSPLISNGVVGGGTPSSKRRSNNINATNENGNHTAMIHSNSNNAQLGKSASKHSINSIGSMSVNSTTNVAAGQQNGELKQLGGSKKRLERDVTATMIQDPESGVVRKSTKKGAAYLTTRVFMQAFTMTFLAEWGDRSQLTTIILAASKDVYGVIAGGVIGHSICTGLAVIGGRMVAAKISVRTVTIVGGVVFLGFAVYALCVRPDDI